MTVTFSAKRYSRFGCVFQCVGCGLLSEAERGDAVTCSTACRVRWHRNPRRAEILASAASCDTTLATMARMGALDLLRPDLAARVMAGEKFDWQTPVREAFIDLLLVKGRAMAAADAAEGDAHEPQETRP